MSSNEEDIRVRIAGDLSDIRRSLQELRKDARGAADEAKRGAGDWNVLGKGLDSLKSRVLGLVGAYVSFRGASQLIRAVIENTVEAEAVQAQLAQRIESTGKSAGFTADQLLEMASSLQDVTKFSDEAIASAETVLLGFQRIRGNEFRGAVTTTLDLATALGEDLTSAAEKVGKALNDPARGILQLTRAGVSFTGQEKALVKQLTEINDVAGAQRVILGALERQFGGAASAARDTLGGSLAALKNAAGELLEAKGGSLNAVRESVESLVALLKDPQTAEAFQTLVAAVLKSAEVLLTAAEKFVQVGQGLGIFLAQIATGIDDPNDKLQVLNRNIAETELALSNLAQTRIDAFGFGKDSFDKEQAQLEAQLAFQKRLLAVTLENQNKRANLPSPRQPAGGTPAPTTAAPALVVDHREDLKKLQADLEAAGALLQQQLKSARDALDHDFKENLISFGDFFKRRADLEQGAISNEIEQRKAALALLDEEIKLQKERGDEIETEENKRAKLVADITVLERQRAEVAVTAARDQADAERKLVEQLDEVRARLAKSQGDTVGARTAELEAEFKDLLKRLVAESDEAGQAIVHKLINTEIARAQLDDVETNAARIQDNLGRAQRRIELQVETGIISERQGRKEIIELHTQTADKLRELIPLAKEFAAATGDPDAVGRVEDLEIEIEKLGATAKTVGQQIKEDFKDAGVSAFADFLSGASSAKDALQSFFDDLRQQIAQFVSERAFDKLFEFLGGLGGGGAGAAAGGGGFAKFFAGLLHTGGDPARPGARRMVPALAFAGAPRLHEGGLLPDEIPAILQSGEEVLSRNDPRNRRNGGGVTVNIMARDANSFRRESPGQIGAQIATSLTRASNRNG